MYSGILIYGSHVEGIQFDKIEISSAEPGIRRIEIESAEDGEVSIHVHVIDVPFPSDAKAIGLREAARIVNALAFELGTRVKNPLPKSVALRAEAKNVTVVEEYGTFSDWVQAVNQLGAERVASLTSALNNREPPGEADYQLFRAA